MTFLLPGAVDHCPGGQKKVGGRQGPDVGDILSRFTSRVSFSETVPFYWGKQELYNLEE